MIYKLIDALTCAFPRSIVGGRPSRLPVAPFAATNLKKCARTRPSPTRLQRTSKNVQTEARVTTRSSRTVATGEECQSKASARLRATRGRLQEAGTRRARAACGSARGARVLLEPRASGGVRDGTRCVTPAHQRDGDLRARARRRKAISRTFFSVCCAIADRFEPFRGYSGRLQVLLLYKLFHPRSSDLRFSLGEAGGGASRARLSPQQTAKNMLLEVSAAARGTRAGRDLGGAVAPACS